MEGAFVVDVNEKVSQALMNFRVTRQSGDAGKILD